MQAIKSYSRGSAGSSSTESESVPLAPRFFRYFPNSFLVWGHWSSISIRDGIPIPELISIRFRTDRNRVDGTEHPGMKS